jgi:hypothetical protein
MEQIYIQVHERKIQWYNEYKTCIYTCEMIAIKLIFKRYLFCFLNRLISIAMWVYDRSWGRCFPVAPIIISSLNAMLQVNGISEQYFNTLNSNCTVWFKGNDFFDATVWWCSTDRPLRYKISLLLFIACSIIQ